MAIEKKHLIEVLGSDGRSAKACSIQDCGRPHYGKGYCNMHYRRLVRHGDPMGGRTPRGEVLRWINDVALQHIGIECLQWPFGTGPNGYGRAWAGGKLVAAHRYICELAHGAPPTPDHESAHSCGNGSKGCVAPGHLEWKTHAENEADKLDHGTHNRGERHGCAKLTEADVLQILGMKGMGPQWKLAERFKVSPRTIGDIQSRRSWSWLSEASKAGA